MKSFSFVRRSSGLMLSLVLISSVSFSQKKEFEGYYINLSGDTIRGVVTDYKQWNYSPDQVSFIPGHAGVKMELTPMNSKGFAAAGYDTYVSYQGARMTNPIEFGIATENDKDDVHDTVSAFLRQIAVTDKYRFYVYKDKRRFNLFYAKDDNVMIELLQKASVINGTYWESMSYKQQLQQLFDEGTKKGNADNVKYSEESISEYVNKQYQGSKYRKTKNENNQLWILGGASFSSFTFTGDKTATFSAANYSSNIAPVAGIGYITNINRNFGQLFLFPQLKIYSFKTSAKTDSTSSVTTNTFKASPVIALGLNVGYNVINKPDLKAFLAAGAGMVSFKNNTHATEVKYSATDARTIVYEMRDLTHFINLQAGFIVKKKFMGWLSYNLPMDVTTYVYSSGNLSVIQAGIGYKL